MWMQQEYWWLEVPLQQALSPNLECDVQIICYHAEINILY